MNMLRIIAAAALVLAFTQDASAARKQSLENWFNQELIPSVVEKLAGHPRFRDERVQFAVLSNGEPAALTNKLALSLRDRLEDAVSDRTDLQIALGLSGHGELDDSGRVDCNAGDVDYIVGIELAESANGRFGINVDVLDLATLSRVPGFDFAWSGQLTAAQFRDYRKPETDSAFLGDRLVPFESSQSDLLAASLAGELGCALLAELAGEYVAFLPESDDPAADKMLTLVQNNLASYKALQITRNPEKANALIEARAHHVDDDLYQYWLTVTPLDPDSGLPSQGASAYVYMAETFSPVTLVSASSDSGLSDRAGLLGDLQLVELHNPRLCSSRGNNAFHVSGSNPDSSCFAIKAISERDTVVFSLYHQLNNGLVRLDTRDCAKRSQPRIVRRKEPLYLPLSPGGGKTPGWRVSDTWFASPDVDTYYVVATGNTQAARALSSHISRLPVRCGSTLRPGLEDKALEAWFQELDAIAEHWSGEIDWQSIRIKEIY